jgi:hypothetical protein
MGGTSTRAMYPVLSHLKHDSDDHLPLGCAVALHYQPKYLGPVKLE